MRGTFTIAVVAFVGLVSCSSSYDVTSEGRFQAVVSKSIVTNKALRLYGIDDQMEGAKGRYNLTTTDYGESNFIALIPAGHPVKLCKIIHYNDLGVSWEQLQGDLDFKGRNYPFAFSLGTSAYPQKWRRIFDAFKAK